MGLALLSLSYLEITNETRLKTILFVPGVFTNTRAHHHKAFFHINTKTLDKIFEDPLGHDSDLWISSWCQEKAEVKLLLQVHTEFKGSLQPVYALNKCTNIDTDAAECNVTEKAGWYGTVCLQSPSKTFHMRISLKLVNCMGSGSHMKCNNTSRVSWLFIPMRKQCAMMETGRVSRLFDPPTSLYIVFALTWNVLTHQFMFYTSRKPPSTG